jgi:hypothetical protein
MQGTCSLPVYTSVPRPAARIIQYLCSQADFRGTMHKSVQMDYLSAYTAGISCWVCQVCTNSVSPCSNNNELVNQTDFNCTLYLKNTFQEHANKCGISHTVSSFWLERLPSGRTPTVSKLWHCSYPSRRQWQQQALPNFWQMTKNLIQMHMHLRPCNPVNEAENHWLHALHTDHGVCFSCKLSNASWCSKHQNIKKKTHTCPLTTYLKYTPHNPLRTKYYRNVLYHITHIYSKLVVAQAIFVHWQNLVNPHSSTVKQKIIISQTHHKFTQCV